MIKANHEIDNNSPTRPDVLTPRWPHFPNPYVFSQEDEVNLLDYWRVIVKRKLLIFALILICTGIGFGISFFSPKKYKAEVSLMPISSSEIGGMSGFASQISSMPLMGGALGDLSKLGGGKTKELVIILKSRALAEKIINHFDLLKILFEKQYDLKTNTFHPGFPAFLKPIPVLEDGVRKFKKKVVKIEEEKKTGLVKISINMKDPVLAAQIGNRMVLELQDFIENNSLTRAKRNRIFLEEQLVKTRAELLETGKEYIQFYGKNNISSIVPQLDIMVGSYQLNPKPFAELREGVTQQLDRLNRQKDSEELKKQASVNAVPGQVYLQFLTLNRDLLARNYALLTQQYELSKIEETKEDLAFQVIDNAEVTVRPSSPDIIINVGVAFIGGIFIALFFAFFLEYIKDLNQKAHLQRSQTSV
jgi:uncharacterized protein involved in exopolysaccharide biosynthesis